MVKAANDDILTRHEQALKLADILVEDIRQLTKKLPEEEDMVMVPEMRETVMILHKDIMMLALADCDEESFYSYTDEAFGKLARLRMHLEMCFGLEYIDAEALARFEATLAVIEKLIALPKKAKLEVVK